MTTTTNWWQMDEIGSQARDAGKVRAVRCRHCGERYELADEPPEECLGCGATAELITPEHEARLLARLEEPDVPSPVRVEPMVITLSGKMVDGNIVLDEDPELPDGQRVMVKIKVETTPYRVSSEYLEELRAARDEPTVPSPVKRERERRLKG